MTDWASLQLGSLAQWFAALSTLLAVLVALFKEDIVRRWRRPQLVVSIEPAKTLLSYTAQRTVPTFLTVDCYYLRLWVQNKGNTRAEKVQVFAAALSKRGADGSFNRVDGFFPMNLSWSYSPPGAPEIYADGISPDMGKHCDLGSVVHPATRLELGEAREDVPAEKTALVLALEVTPNTRSNIIPPGVYHLVLRIAAANAAPTTRTLELNLTGDWFPDEKRMFSDGLGARFLQ
jgi:hypothetical protein